MDKNEIRKSGEEWKLTRQEFRKRYLNRFKDQAFGPHEKVIEEIERVAWEAYEKNHKAPHTTAAGKEYQDPQYQLSDEWREARERIRTAQKEYEDPAGEDQVLIICASDRNDHTCPGEISKSYRLAKIAAEAFKHLKVACEILYLSEMVSEYGKVIYPCKGCVSTAMPLCHWPCSCYPHHGLGQVNDWMNDIYPKWVRAHGIMIITPVYWHQAPSALKLMMDRLVCADGGNPDPTTTQGKDVLRAKEIELNGWEYPRHLAGRNFSLIVHGDTVGVDELKNALSSWLQEMMLVPTSQYGQLGRYIGYYGTYAESHKALDKDHYLLEEVKSASEALVLSIKAQRAQLLNSFNPELKEPRPK